MSSIQGEIPALEPSTQFGIVAALSSPRIRLRRNKSYGDRMNVPLLSPPADWSGNILWKDPVFPQHKYRKSEEEGDNDGNLLTFEAPTQTVPVVKAKASTDMNSLLLSRSQEDFQRFEHQAGLTDTGYYPRKGLPADESCFHRLPEGTDPKLRMPSGELKEDRLTTSAQTTPSGTPSVTSSVTLCVSPYASPCVSRRAGLKPTLAPILPTTEVTAPNINPDMGGNEGGGGGVEKWNFFGTRSLVTKSPTDPGSETSIGFSLQSYLGLQKSSTMDYSKSQVNLKVEDPANFIPPKIEITGIEAKCVPSRPHKLKPRDLNVLTPSGF
ncbi:putative monooxygenase p33MONOX [Thalassophryne amazonica]|uniref:putative monooxygenase p33MONOX n=1 Tax=Thalassophryne amazonica TaxID=390379 RepID=UPI001470E0E5|nr:putative monooxygenase p33MONOX [Thalassophryne amazonica]